MEAHLGAFAFLLIMLGQCLAVIAVANQRNDQDRYSQ